MVWGSSGLKTSYRPQSGAQNSLVLWNNKQLPAYFIMYMLHMRKCHTLVVYCDIDCIGMLCTLYSANAVKNVILVTYSFYSWADHRRLLLAWPSVSLLINENWFLKLFMNF